MGIFDALANIKKSQKKKEPIVKHEQKKQESNEKKRVFKIGTIVMFKDNAQYYYNSVSGAKIELSPEFRAMTWRIEKYDENNERFVYLSYKIQNMYIKARENQLYIAPEESASQYGCPTSNEPDVKPADTEKRHDTSEDIRLIDKYVSSIENVCVYGQPLIPLLYDMITIGQKGYIDRDDNLLIWKQLRNIEPSTITQKNSLSDLDIKAELNNFLLTQFTYCQRNFDWNFYAKYNFATLIIDWLGITTFEEESNTYQRVKKVEQDIVQLNDVEQIMEYTKAFIREYDTVPDGNSISIFAECVDSHLNTPIEDTKKFEKESANPIFHSVKKTFQSHIDDLKDKEKGILSKASAAIDTINPWAYLFDGLNYSEAKKMDIDDLRELSEAKLFLACGYLILRVHALASDVINTNADVEQDDDVFDFDSI